MTRRTTPSLRLASRLSRWLSASSATVLLVACVYPEYGPTDSLGATGGKRSAGGSRRQGGNLQQAGRGSNDTAGVANVVTSGGTSSGGGMAPSEGGRAGNTGGGTPTGAVAGTGTLARGGSGGNGLGGTAQGGISTGGMLNYGGVAGCTVTIVSGTSVCTTSCGDGVRTGDEGCDDHNTQEGDGCSSTCRVELNFGCTSSEQCRSGLFCDPTPGQNRCEYSGVCGNGYVEGSESCDDGNTIDGDACPSSCRVNSNPPCTRTADCGANGVCDTTPGQMRCEPAGVCGNGAVEGSEYCDDGGTIDGDGCSSSCLGEANSTCTASSQCRGDLVCDMTAGQDRCEAKGACGNGNVEGDEACDDGSTNTGDGCDAACKFEAGQSCSDDGH